jgi:hypothetical protein
MQNNSTFEKAYKKAKGKAPQGKHKDARKWERRDKREEQ